MRVTVGIPFYNSEKTLATAIRSVFAQTYPDWQLILLDDGSTDSSPGIARAVRDPRVVVVSDGRNRGLQYRLNQIAQMAGGDLLARMDSDDIMHPERLACQVEYLDRHPETDLVGTAVYTIDSLDRLTGVRLLGSLDTRPRSILRHGLMSHPSVTGRTEWFRNNPYNEEFTRAEDYELWCRTSVHSVFSKLDGLLLYYREGYKEPRAYLRYYLDDAKFCRKCLLLHGPSVVGWPETMILVAKTAAKAGAYCAATAVGAQNHLIKKRARAPSEQQRKSGIEGLRQVLQTPVRGLPPTGSAATVLSCEDSTRQ